MDERRFELLCDLSTAATTSMVEVSSELDMCRAIGLRVPDVRELSIDLKRQHHVLSLINTYAHDQIYNGGRNG